MAIEYTGGVIFVLSVTGSIDSEIIATTATRIGRRHDEAPTKK